MEEKLAIAALSALAQETRLGVFRRLVRAGTGGLSAGDIATAMGVPASTLSHHLSLLERAGLLRSWRVQRQIFYATDYEGTRRLLAFLMEDCCQGAPEICADMVTMARCAPAPAPAACCDAPRPGRPDPDGAP